MNRPSVASCPEPVALPVIFIPGIMGSRLRNAENGDIAWDPTASIGAGLSLAVTGAEDKRNSMVGDSDHYFNPDFLEVDTGAANENLSAEAIERGWGGVLWEHYGDAYNWLRLQTLAVHPNEKQVPKCGRIFLEAWAYPYNWTNDNKASAEGQDKPSGVGSDVGLRKVIETAISKTTEKYKGQDVRILKPILITHSMGGLVARAFCKLLDGEDMVHGVIHGAMPTDGVPATYKRMLAGFEGGIEAAALGWNQAEVTATAGNMPGALQLLPNKRHKGIDGSRNWLRISTRQGVMLESLPRADPYSEIYRNQSDWWKLIDRELLNPGGGDAYESYLLELAKAETFHDALGPNGFHPNTRMFYSAGDDHRAWDHINWVLNQRTPDINEGLEPSSDGLGTVTFLNYNVPNVQGRPAVDYEHSFTIRGPSAPGDGTVHSGSGKHVPVMSVPTTSGFEHAAAFNSFAARKLVADWLVEMVQEQL